MPENRCRDRRGGPTLPSPWQAGLATATVALAATAAMAVTTCFVPAQKECCYLLTNPPAMYDSCYPGCGFCFCAGVITSNLVDDATGAANGQAGQNGLDATVPKCECHYIARTCNNAGNCVFLDNIHATAQPLPPKGDPCTGT